MNFSEQNRWMLGVGTLVFLCLLFFLASLSTAFAQNTAVYTPLVGIPGLATGQGTGLASYLNRLYIITIGIGAIIAFIKIAMAGVKWSMSDVVTDKGAAKEDIKGALLGLAILLIPFIVLNTIYPGLTSLNILGNAGSSRVDLKQTSTPVAAPTPTGTGPVLNADGSQSGNVTLSACNARAAAVGGTAVFSPTYVGGTVQYGTCTVTPAPATGPTAPLRLLRTQMGMVSITPCNTLATSMLVSPLTYTEAKFTQATGKCEVWGRP
jgi:hypothetical protein